MTSRGVQSDEFLGDEAEVFRSSVNGALPPQLRSSSQAWGIVGAAVALYADELESYQGRLVRLNAQLVAQHEVVASRQAGADRARATDSAATQSFQRRTAEAAATSGGEHAGSGGSTAVLSAPAPTAPGAAADLTKAQAAAQTTTDAANGVLGEHRLSLGRCCGEIDRAKALRFAEPPGFWGRLTNAVGGWIADHVDVFKAISGFLKQLSSIAGVLAMIPIFAPVMGPIAVGAGSLAVGIDVGIKLATGEGDWSQILLDGASMIPGARAAKAVMVADVAYTGYNVATGKADWKDLAMVTAMGAMGAKNGRRSGKADGPKTANGAKPAWMGDQPTRREARRHAEEPFRAVEHEPYWPRRPDSALATGQPVWHDPHATAIGGDRPTINNFSRSGGSPGEHDVVIHGLDDGRPYAPQGNTNHQGRAPDYHVNTEQIAEAVRASPHYVRGTPVRFVSCHAARGSAQELADSLGVPVRAVRHPVSLDENGQVWMKRIDPKTKNMGPPEEAVLETFDPVGSILETGRS